MSEMTEKSVPNAPFIAGATRFATVGSVTPSPARIALVGADVGAVRVVLVDTDADAK